MVDIASTISANSSDRLTRSSQARSTSGASTTPRNRLAPPPRPTTPETPKVRRNRKDSPRTAARSTPQCHSSAASAENTMTSGKIWKAMTSGAASPGFSANGKGAPPR